MSNILKAVYESDGPSENELRRMAEKRAREAYLQRSYDEQQARYVAIIGPDCKGKPTRQQLEQQAMRLERLRELQKERRLLEEAFQKALAQNLEEKERLEFQCIHFEPNGEPSIDSGIYHMCRHCPNSW